VLIVRVYSILDQTAVEVSCLHGDLANHLVYREQRERLDGASEDLWAAADALHRAVELDERGRLEWSDDCGL